MGKYIGERKKADKYMKGRKQIKIGVRNKYKKTNCILQ
jgi:hypothetical protein